MENEMTLVAPPQAGKRVEWNGRGNSSSCAVVLLIRTSQREAHRIWQ